MDKKTVRKQQQLKIAQYLNENTIKPDFYEKLFITKEYRQAQVIGITMNMPQETPTKPIIDRALKDGKTVVIPKTFADFKMEFIKLTGETNLKLTKFGVLEPVNGKIVPKDEIDLLMIPGLAFSRFGDRLGFGAGFYDRYLKNYQGNTIALVIKPQLYDEPIWPVAELDVSIKKIIG